MNCFRASARPTLAYCGRLDRTKGVPLLLRAFARLKPIAPGARLRLVGEGPLRESLEDLVRALGLEEMVSFRGLVPPELVEHEISDAWAVVVPSLWAEPLGLVAIEAILRGIPVVASAAGGLGETVEHGTSGLLFSNGNEDELAGHLEAIVTARAFLDHAVPDAAVRRVVRRHDPELHTERLRGILMSVAGVHASTNPSARTALRV